MPYINCDESAVEIVIDVPDRQKIKGKFETDASSGSFQSSYAALENIINQCFSDPTANFDPNSGPNGRWALGDDEWYWISMNYQAPEASITDIDDISHLGGG